MIKVENIDVWGFEHAIRGMRNPLNSWDKSDSGMKFVKGIFNDQEFVVGKNDLDLMRRLYKAGTEHRKYLRQIIISLDITAPLYWWKEFDTYKVGTVANSCSTMHKIAAKEFELDDFSHEHLFNCTDEDIKDDFYDECGYLFAPDEFLELSIAILNACRTRYLETKDKKWWWQMIQLLPSSYNQKRTVTMNYENVVSMIHQRTGHKLDEWNDFVEILKNLPYIKEITDGTEA